MKKIIILLCILSGAAVKTKAQEAIFLDEGKIEFTRTLNLYANNGGDDDDEAWNELMKKSRPKFKISYFDLYFSADQWLYKPGRGNPDNNKLWEQPAENNVVFGDYASGKGITQKNILGDIFLIQDSLRHIKWKITEENKVIAGFNCLRANAIIMDSIYVVAFFTNEIVTPGGPESFSGLPGMILGVSLPHEHISWFADKIERVPVKQVSLTAPVKGKKIDRHSYSAKIAEVSKDWGKWGRKLVEAAEW